MKSYVIVGQLGAQFGVYKTAKNQMPIVQFSSVQFSSIQFSSVENSTERNFATKILFISYYSTISNELSSIDKLIGRFGVFIHQFGQSGQHGGDLSWDWGRSRQVISTGQETVLISGPGQRDFLSFGRDVVRRSLVGVARLVSDHFLGVGLVTGRTVRTGVAKHSNMPQSVQFDIHQRIQGFDRTGLGIDGDSTHLHLLLPSSLRTSEDETMVIWGSAE